ncbi:MAG: NADH-quinone oxidoreductase subunit NuoD [Spirochaetae bacterium HGW-Spirochaetae-3]|jgi:NADH-quinone oxidoreductase subunit D|nr:MAG: NADH-quinone oxidoreductase subunit NuoD [Spirochaetae bacterium HGW-Spirochaetae-3]
MRREKQRVIPPAERATPDLDSGKYLVMWQGPQHPGITGNMSLRLVAEGDTVVDCETHVGYLHRGFEKLMERRLYMQNFPLVCRIAVPEPDFNEYCYAAALEELAGIVIPEKAVWLRTLSLEMMRLASFLMWIGGQAGAFGHGTIAQWSVTMRDYVLDLFEELTGGRIYHMYIIPGGVRGDVPAGFYKRVLETMAVVEKNLDDIELVMFHNAVFKMRAEGLGYIPRDWVDHYGITGPNARAAGVARDLRKDSGYLAYPRLDFQPIVGTESDAYERARLRLGEMYQAIDLIRQIVDMAPKDGPFRERLPNPLYWRIPAGETYVSAECTRGEYGFYVVSDGSDKPRRVAVRGPSYTHAVSVMERLVRGVNIADVAGLMVSLHTYPPEIER